MDSPHNWSRHIVSSLGPVGDGSETPSAPRHMASQACIKLRSPFRKILSQATTACEGPGAQWPLILTRATQVLWQRPFSTMADDAEAAGTPLATFRHGLSLRRRSRPTAGQRSPCTAAELGWPIRPLYRITCSLEFFTLAPPALSPHTCQRSSVLTHRNRWRFGLVAAECVVKDSFANQTSPSATGL